MNKSPALVEHPRPRFAPWLMEPMLRNKATYMKVALAAAMVNVFGLITSLFTMTVYDRVVPNNAFTSLAALSIGLAVVVVFDFLLRILRAYFTDLAGADIDHDVGGRVFRRLVAIRLDQKKGSTGALTGMMRELETLRDFFASATMTALVDVPFIIVTLVFIAILGGPLVWVPLATIPIVVGAGWLTRPALDRLSAKSMSEGLSKQSVLVETVGALEMVKTSGAARLLGRRWSRANVAHGESSTRQRLVSTIATTVAASANTLSYAGTVIAGVFLIADHRLTTGALVACSILSGRAVQPLATIASLLSRLSATRTAYKQINGIMETGSEEPGAGALHPARFDGRIELRGIEFRYPGAAEKTLDGLNLVIPTGQRVALLGRVGSGKSTIARLILGLYPPQEGLVMIDGTDIRQYDPWVMRGLIGTALQEPVLLSGSVRENIVLARDGIDDAEMLRVAELSGTHGFIGQMANGYDLQLADRGEGLSGGQRQAISLARALAGRPRILVFDEPTSAMDQGSEAQLIGRLETELRGRTFVLITHRPALLRLVERIVVVENGRVVQDGPRDAVLKELQRHARPPEKPDMTYAPHHTHLEDLADRIEPKAVSNLLLWLILGFVAIFVIWASVVKLDRTVHASGRVVPSSRLQVLSNLEGGIVSEILVRAGDVVRRGQPLVRLDRTQAGSELGSSEVTVGALAAKIARLQAEIAGRDPVYAAAPTSEIAEQIGIERSLHAARMSDLASLSAAAAAREAQASRAVAEARAAYQSRVSARDAARRQLDMMRPLVERGIEPQLTLIQLENAAAVATTDAAQASAGIARTQSAVVEARASLAQVRGAWRAQAGTDLATAQAELASRRQAVPALAARLGRATVSSPVSGRVNRVLVSTVGASIGAGQPIAEVVPSADALTVEAKVNPKDIASVRISQHAKINITAYESGIYGGMDGRVVTISPDATVDERTSESYYTVRVRADAQNFRGPDGQRLAIGPGMTADVNLIGDKRSVMAYILSPFTRLREDAFRE